MIGNVQQFLTWVLVYGYPAIVVVQVTSSIGLPLPMTAILLFAGSLAAVASLNIFLLFALTLVSSVVGDTIIYIVGRRFGDVASRRWGWLSSGAPVERVTARGGWRRWTGPSIFFSRWLFTPACALTSVTAGLTHYPLKRFLIIDVAGEAVASALFLGLGYTLGTDWEYIWSYISGLPGILTLAGLGAVLVTIGARKLIQQSKKSPGAV